tara:strand:- start:377 stop:1822 length:1446 start_codon:yes stop_codon:yes gene_type:complete
MKFKTTPYKHQLDAFNISKDKKAYAYFMEMGTGKSKVLIDNLAYLHKLGQINAALILAPKGAYRIWTNVELEKHMPDSIDFVSTHWTPTPKKKEKESLINILKFDGQWKLKILVMNIEALSTAKGAKFAAIFLSKHIALMAVDESTSIKNHKAKRSKVALHLGNKASHRRILTGEPVTRSPLDLYTQMAFLSPHIIGHSSYYSFRNRYAILRKRITNAAAFDEVVGYKNIEELQSKIQYYSFRARKEDCLDLPPKIYQTREVPLTPEQSKIYKDLVKTSRAELEEADNKGVISVPMMLTKLLRLHQVTCGNLKDDNGKTYNINNNRIKALLETLEETDGKAIIWCNYIQDIHKIEEALQKEFGKDSCVTYYGATTSDERVKAIEDFQGDSPVRFFIGQSRTGGFGLTLTKARTVIYYSNNYDLEVRLQSEDRAHRIGQNFSVTYVDLVSPNTVDEKIIKSLKAKRNLSMTVMGDEWKDWIN